MIDKLSVPGGRTCFVLGQNRFSQSYQKIENPFEEKLCERVIYFVKLYGRFGYRKVTGLLQIPQKQPKRVRLWFNDGSCIRQRPLYPNHVGSYDFVAERTRYGRAIKILNIIDENTKECICSHVARKITWMV